MAPLRLDVAQMASTFTECILYGVFLVSFVACVKALWSNRLSSGLLKRWLAVATVLLFFFATLDVAFGLKHMMDAFIFYEGPGGAIAELSDISYWVNVMKGLNYICQTSVADGILIYRCFMMYGQRWRVIIGLLILWAAGLVCEFFSVYTEFTLHQSTNLNADSLKPWITSMLSITLTLNLIATGMIVLRIWSVERLSSRSGLRVFRDIDHYGGSTLTFTMRVIIESGAIYTSFVLLFFVTFLASNNAQYLASHSVVPVIGINFNMIIIRVSQRRTVDEYWSSPPGGVLTQLSPEPNQGTRNIISFQRYPACSTSRSGSRADSVGCTNKPAGDIRPELVPVIDISPHTTLNSSQDSGEVSDIVL